MKWVHAEDWITYQKKTFVTPVFGYISGHSTFSRAAAQADRHHGHEVVPGRTWNLQAPHPGERGGTTNR